METEKTAGQFTLPAGLAIALHDVDEVIDLYGLENRHYA